MEDGRPHRSHKSGWMLPLPDLSPWGSGCCVKPGASAVVMELHHLLREAACLGCSPSSEALLRLGLCTVCCSISSWP